MKIKMPRILDARKLDVRIICFLFATSPHEPPRALVKRVEKSSEKSGEVYNQHAVVRVSELMHHMQSHSDDSSGEEKQNSGV